MATRYMPRALRVNKREVFELAHSRAKSRCAPHFSQRYGDCWNPEARGWVPKTPYRQILAAELRMAWRDLKSAVANAAMDAELAPVPADIAARIVDIRVDAWWEPITMAGTARMVAILDAASALENASRHVA